MYLSCDFQKNSIIFMKDAHIVKGVALYFNKLKFYFTLEYIVAIFCLNTPSGSQKETFEM